MSFKTNETVNRLRFFGLRNSDAVQMTRTIQKWIESNGTEWAVDRLKSIKQLMIMSIGNNDYTGITTSIWVSRKSKSFKPRGIFGCLFSENMSFKRKVRSLNALLVYSQFISPTLTSKQWRKFQSSVTAPPVECSIVPHVPDFWNIGNFNEGYFTDIENYPLSKERRTYDGIRSVPEYEVTAWFNYASRLGIVRDVLHGDVKLLPARSTLRQMLWKEFTLHQSVHNTVGRIGLIQETGFKLRAVANPNRIVQIILEPLKKVLGEALRLIPQDCTFDQGKCIPVIVDWLTKGTTVHSIDLSDATNLFPLSLTLKVLRSLDGDGKKGWKSHIDYFKRASIGLWSIPGSHQDISWTKGQPLGLGPSFFAFALSHHYLMVDLGISEYFILGDDVVIRHTADAIRYRALLNDLGCLVSESKTISSDVLAEFAGKLITPKGVISPLKWRHTSDINFMDQVKLLGPGGVRFLSKDQRRAVDLVKEIPEWYGGLGWNPHGKTMIRRIDENFKTIKDLESTHLRPFRKEGFSEEVLTYFLENHLSMPCGLPHESYAMASQPDRAGRDETPYQSIIRFNSIGREKMSSAQDGWTPLERVSDPRAIPPALRLVRALSEA